MKMIYKMLIGLAVCVVLLSVIFNDIRNKVGSGMEEYSSYVGEQFVMGDDTFIVVDYSIFGETFTLSNGQKVNFKLVAGE